MRYFSIKNWDELQHYKDRNPPWIKLHNKILNDYEFACLQDASKLLLMLLWSLASQLNNRIPDDPDWISKRLPIKGKINTKELIDKGFLILAQDASNALAECSPETYREETEKNKEKYTKENFESVWKSYPRKDGSKTKAEEKYRDAIRSGVPHDKIFQSLESYKNFVAGNHKEGGNLSFAHLATWLNQKRWESDYSSQSDSSPLPEETYDQFCVRTGQTPVYDEVNHA